jgi:hypothetical protein
VKTKFLIAGFVSLLLTTVVQGHDCSSGANGGMDATGNDCNGEILAVPVLPNHDRGVPTRSTWCGTERAAPCSKCAVKHGTARQIADVRRRRSGEPRSVVPALQGVH